MPGASPQDRARFPLFGSLIMADAASARLLFRRCRVEIGDMGFLHSRRKLRGWIRALEELAEIAGP